MASRKKNNIRSNSRKSNGNGKKKNAPRALRTMLAILLVIAAIGLAFSAIRAFVPQLLNGASLSGKLAAEVNGQPITMADLENGYMKLPYQYQMFMTKGQYLDQLIDQLLLRQEAARQGIEISDSDADANIRLALAQSNITAEEFQQMLDNQSINYEELLQLSKDQLMVEEIIRLEVAGKINVTTEQALQYYNDNAESFKNPAVMKVRHILLATLLVNRTENESRALAQDILLKVSGDKSNFCDLVSEYTDDTASIPKCGEYDFVKGQLPEEFENWADSSKIGDVGTVDTVYGTHVLHLIGKTPETVLRFGDIQEQIVSSLEIQAQRDLYQDFLAKLRKESEVKNYFEDKADADTSVPALEQPGDVQLDSEGVAQLDAAEISEQEDALKETSGTIEIVIEEPEEKQAAEAIVADQVDPVACLKAKGTTLYGAGWNSDTARQLSVADASSFDYVDCSVEGDYRAEADVCKGAGIKAYPTWVVGGVQYLGVYSIEALASLAGCN